MSENLTVGLTKPQLDVLMRGLRYVRSSYLMEPLEPTDEVIGNRNSKLVELAELKDRLEKAVPADNSVNA